MFFCLILSPHSPNHPHPHPGPTRPVPGKKEKDCWLPRRHLPARLQPPRGDRHPAKQRQRRRRQRGQRRQRRRRRQRGSGGSGGSGGGGGSGGSGGGGGGNPPSSDTYSFLTSIAGLFLNCNTVANCPRL